MSHDVFVSADECLEVVSGLTGARGKAAITGFGFSWQAPLRPSEDLPGIAVDHPLTITDAGSAGWARAAPATTPVVLTLMNKNTAIGTVTWAVGQQIPTFALNGGQFAAVKGDFIYALAPLSPDAAFGSGGFTLAGD